jgi:hypothetical protein
MTDTEHRAALELGARLAAGGELAPTEWDEYLDLTEPVGGAVSLPAQRG